MFLKNVYLLVLVLFLCAYQSKCCTQQTFEVTHITAVKNILLDGELTDYNFFSKINQNHVAVTQHVTGCLMPRRGMEDLENVVAIQIRGERVPIFYEGAVQNLPYLHSLHVVSCGVTRIEPKAFLNLPWLTIIKIQDNSIEMIPYNLFNNLLVKKLILTFNNISFISPEAFNDMPRLESVNLEGNKLRNWNNDWFVNCPNVRFLSVKFNHLETLQARVFKNIEDQLERLYLSFNNIWRINSRAFTGLRKLTDLNLSNNNNLSELHDNTFSYLENLKMIDFSETSITCFPEPLLSTLRSDALLWINNTPLNSTCKPILDEWAKYNDNNLTFYITLKNTTKSRSNFT